VVVIGQGTVGLFHDFMLRKLGAERIIAIEPVPERLAAGRNLGIDAAIDVTGRGADPAVLDLTGGQGADVVVEAVGSTETLNQALRLARQGGRVAVFGLPDSSEPVPFDWDTLYRKSLTMHAVHGSQEEPGLPDFRRAADMIIGGEIDVSPMAAYQAPIWRVQEAFDVAYARANGVLKVSLAFHE
jgi:threonine dehydrogenase-like Zn-dependent dehydrogenase